VSVDAEAIAREVAAAGDAWNAGDYGAAVAHYELALQAGAEGADLWFNLGNALYRAGEQGRAVLAFERALRRDPGDEGARQNLRLVRSQIEGAEVVEPPPFHARLGARVDPDAAAALLVVAWSVACAAVVLRRVLAGAVARAVATAALVVALIGTAAAAAATHAAWAVRNDGWAIVVEAGEVLQAPEPSAPRLFTAPEGISLRADRRIGGWIHVRAGERDGWIEAARVEPIDP